MAAMWEGQFDPRPTSSVERIRRVLPPGFYPDLSVEERVEKLVEQWRRAVRVIRVVEQEMGR